MRNKGGQAAVLQGGWCVLGKLHLTVSLLSSLDYWTETGAKVKSRAGKKGGEWHYRDKNVKI